MPKNNPMYSDSLAFIPQKGKPGIWTLLVPQTWYNGGILRIVAVWSGNLTCVGEKYSHLEASKMTTEFAFILGHCVHLTSTWLANQKCDQIIMTWYWNSTYNYVHVVYI